MAQFRPDQQPPTPNPKNPRQPGSWIRMALLAGLGLYIVVLLVPFIGRVGGAGRADITYSQLKTEINKGDIAGLLTLQGQDAQGSLNHTITGLNGVTSADFDATMPTDVGLIDPTLITALDSQHVNYQFKPDTGGLANLLLSSLPFVALLALMFWLRRRRASSASAVAAPACSRPARPRQPFTMSPASTRRSSSCKRWSTSSVTRRSSRSSAAGCRRASC